MMKYCIIIIVLLIVACKNTDDKKSLPKNDASNFKVFKNKSTYSINRGDTLEIYHSTNSCCKYCQPNADKLQHLDFIGSKNVIPAKKGCEGCNWTSALMFVAKTTGVDTIKDAIIHPTAICKDTLEGLRKYIVRIK